MSDYERFPAAPVSRQHAGNSESIIRKHYLKMVAKVEAKKFWSIMPNEK